MKYMIELNKLTKIPMDIIKEMEILSICKLSRNKERINIITYLSQDKKTIVITIENHIYHSCQTSEHVSNNILINSMLNFVKTTFLLFGFEIDDKNLH